MSCVTVLVVPAVGSRIGRASFSNLADLTDRSVVWWSDRAQITYWLCHANANHPNCILYYGILW